MPYDPKTLKNVVTHLPSWASEPTPEALNALREAKPLSDAEFFTRNLRLRYGGDPSAFQDAPPEWPRK